MEHSVHISWPRCGVPFFAHCHRKPHMHPFCSLGPGPPPFHPGSRAPALPPCAGNQIYIRRILCDPYALAAHRICVSRYPLGPDPPALPIDQISPPLRGLQDQCRLIRMQQFAFVAPLTCSRFHVLNAGRPRGCIGIVKESARLRIRA